MRIFDADTFAGEVAVVVEGSDLGVDSVFDGQRAELDGDLIDGCGGEEELAIWISSGAKARKTTSRPRFTGTICPRSTGSMYG